MARIELAPGVFDDLDRFSHHLEQHEASDIAVRLGEIIQAVDVLRHSPRIGRPVRGGKRELVIGSGARGYVALYRFVARMDTVFVLAIRSQGDARTLVVGSAIAAPTLRRI